MKKTQTDFIEEFREDKLIINSNQNPFTIINNNKKEPQSQIKSISHKDNQLCISKDICLFIKQKPISRTSSKIEQKHQKYKKGNIIPKEKEICNYTAWKETCQDY